MNVRPPEGQSLLSRLELIELQDLEIGGDRCDTSLREAELARSLCGAGGERRLRKRCVWHALVAAKRQPLLAAHRSQLMHVARSRDARDLVVCLYKRHSLLGLARFLLLLLRQGIGTLLHRKFNVVLVLLVDRVVVC